LVVENQSLDKFATMLNYRTMIIPFIHLGFQIVGNPRKRSYGKLVLEKIRNKLEDGNEVIYPL